LVLGGGGVAGIAWEVGILARLADLGSDLAAQADLVVGTSAGACVGALVAGQTGYDALIATQRLPVSQTQEQMPEFDLNLLVEIFGLMTSKQHDPAEARRKIGVLALATATVSEDERRKIIAWRVPTEEWPDRRLIITAVNAETGERVLFDASSGVSMVDAVAASCAVPGIWPPVTIGGQRYMDGGVYSTCNAGLAKGYARTIVLCPVAMGPTDDEASTSSHSSLTIVADAEAQAAFGPNLLDPASRGPALDAGSDQAAKVADEVRRYWTLR
jgi:NTE family protein